MRLLLALAVIVVALVAWLAFGPGRSAPLPAELEFATAGSNAADEERTTTKLDQPIDTAAPTRAVERPVVKPAVLKVATAADSACRLTGRVVDDRGAPIAGARVLLQEWGDFPEVTVSHETMSAAGGVFSLEFAAPASAKQSLSITAKPFYIPAERWFGNVGQAEGRRLSASGCDAGTIELARCGTVEGRVLSDAGTPVDGIGVLLQGSKHGMRGGMTDPNGAYSISELPADQWSVTIKNDEWLQSTKISVDVELSRVATAPDLVLTSTPSISGVVVDADGAPIPGISVESWSAEERSLTRATSAEDGAFVLRLPAGETITLAVPESCAYRKFGGLRGDPTCTFLPGARNVRIVLARAPVMTFRVVDAATRAPIERFGLWVFCRSAGWDVKGLYAGKTAIEPHPGGTVALSYGELARVHALADGFAPAELEVAADPSTPNVQTIALQRGASITGRVLVLGRAAAGARASVARESTSESGAGQVLHADSGTGWNRDFDQVMARGTHEVESDANGSFAIDDLVAGTYTLRLFAPRGARTLLHALVVPASGVLALGDLEIAPESVVRGVVRTAAGTSPVACTITFEDHREVRVEGADGRFELGGFAAGAHWLVWSLASEKRGLDSSDARRVDFVLGVGETLEVVIDAAAFAPCAVTVRVLHHGRPVADAQVELRSNPVPGAKFLGWAALGYTNQEGVVTGTTDGGRRARIEVLDASRRLLGWSTEEIEFAAGGRHESTIEVGTGKLVVELPASITRPENGRITVICGGNGGSTGSSAYSGSVRSGGSWGNLEWSSDTIDIGEVPVRIRSVYILFERFERDATSADPKAGSWVELRKPFSTQVEIKDGETTRVVVP